MTPPVTLLWVRQCLRLADNPALAQALSEGHIVIPVYLWSPEEEGEWPPGAASRWWLHHSLASLQKQYQALGAQLILCRGPSVTTFQELIQHTGATRFIYDLRFEPAAIRQQQCVEQILKNQSVSVQGVLTNLLFHPASVKTGKGEPYKVFTPYSKACLSTFPPATEIPVPSELKSPSHWPESLPLESLSLLPSIDWAGGMRDFWKPGEANGLQRLNEFAQDPVTQYEAERNRPDHDGTSRFSPYLHFGELSPGQIWREIHHAAPTSGNAERSADVFIKEILWREFAYHLLYHFPHTATEPLREQFKDFPWKHDPAGLQAWQQGNTGYPIVDAGMRQLWHTGWMHNRVRMIVGSFLVKDLLIPWQDGARWFWDTLVDADLAANTMNWQWVAGSGADSAPYFRIFNPVLQGQTYDPQGSYVRQWVPEIAQLNNKQIHQPWQIEVSLFSASTSELYPPPIVDHAEARQAALKALASIKSPTLS